MESKKGLTQDDYDALKAELFELQIKEQIDKEVHTARIREILKLLAEE